MGKLLDTVAGITCITSGALIGGYCLYKTGLNDDEYAKYILPLIVLPLGLYELGQWFLSRRNVQISDAHGNSNHLPGLSQEDFERQHRDADRAIEINNRLMENNK